MSYQLSIDEMTEARISAELDKRVVSRQRGGCDYCGRAPTTVPCKFPDRHSDERIDRDAKKCILCNGDGVGPQPVGVGYCGHCDGTGLYYGHTRSSGWKGP